MARTLKAGDTIIVQEIEQDAVALRHGQATREGDKRWLVVSSRTFYDPLTGGYVEKAALTRRVVPDGVEIPDPDLY